MATAVNNDTKIPYDIEIVDSSETLLKTPNYSLSSVDNLYSPPMLLQLSHDQKISNETLNMTATLKDKNWDDAKQHIALSSLPDSTSRPLPVVNAAPGQKPPYYNVRNEIGDMKGNTSLEVRTPSYREVLSVQTSPEINSYSQLNSVLDHYDLLAPVQRLDMPKVNVTNSQYQVKAASKKCVTLSVICILVALVTVLVVTLTTFLIVRAEIDHSIDTRHYSLKNQIDHSMDTRLSSLRKLQDEMNAKVLGSLQAMCSSCNNASDLTVVNANNCFCLYRKRLSWEGARDFCLAKGNGVHLAEIYNREENDFLMPILQASANMGIWLGGSDLDKEGDWVWNYTGKPIEIFQPSQWGEGEPNSNNDIVNIENCLEVFNYGVFTFIWNDTPCSGLKPFLCHSQLIQSRCFC